VLESVKAPHAFLVHRKQMTSNAFARACRASSVVAALLLAGTPVDAMAGDAPPLILEHLTTSDGLPQGTVFATLQDSQGFVWLGTEDGLVRYDGHELVRYAYSRSARGGLPGNYIQTIVEDANHDLWIAIKDAGLARWSRASDSFTVYSHDAANPGSLASNHVHALLVDPRNRIWIGTSDAGIDILNPRSRQFEHLRHNPRDPDSLLDDRIFSLTRDRSGSVWVGTEIGLDRLQPESRAFTHFRHESGNPHSLSGGEVLRVLEDHTGALWVGTFDGGLDRLDRDGRVIEVFHHDPQQPTSLSDDDVRAILEDHAGHLWIGTADGLELLNRTTGQFSHYHHDPSNSESLRDSFIMSLYEDDAGLVWIGTRAGGVSRWNPRSWELGGFRPGWLENKLVTAFADAPDNRVWIASRGGGLVQLDDTGKATDLDDIVGRRDALGDSRVMSLRQDRRGTLWIGTMSSGISRLAPAGHLQSIPVKPGDPRALSAPGIMTLFEARDGEIWIGTNGGGANVLDPLTGLVRQLPHDASTPGSVSSANVTAISEDHNGNFWIGTDGGGLDLARADGTVVAVFRHDPSDAASLPANTVYALAVDTQNRVWAATDGGGLALVVGSDKTPSSIRFRVVSREDGLSSDTLYGVLADASGHLWLSSDAGLMRYEPDTGAIKTYHREHGLQGEEFNYGAYLRLRDGRLAFGGPGGFNIFDPSRLTESRQPPRLALTRIEVLGVPMSAPAPFWLLDRIALDYRASIVTLDFGALDFASPKRNRLAYRMAGLTDRWIDIGSQHRISLTNLDAGNHLLEVRAANSDSVWSETPLRLTIHRDPAPWRSPWAYTAYALAALGFIASQVRRQRLRFKRIVSERQRLKSEVALRTRELLESNRQLEDAIKAKGNFLDRMSHELRTPMNGVVGMTELLARTTLSPTQARLTGTIRTSARILLQIVNDLLDLSKIQAGKVALEELPLDLLRLVEECASLFAGAADAKGVDLIVCPPAGHVPNLSGDALRIRQVLMNLIANAIKFTAQGAVVVKTDFERVEPGQVSVRISVSDTGIGMDATTIHKIFEPFTQADESTTRRFGGSGLGLAICRELTELMHGRITVESKPQVGSTFCVSLPLKLGADTSRTGPPALPPHRARIRTRRPALAESLTRHLTALGLNVSEDERENAAVSNPGAEIIILDASSELEYLQSRATTPVGLRAALVVVATANEVESKGLEQLVAAEAIVLKPVHRDALHESLAAAMGVTASPAASAPQSLSEVAATGGHVLLVEDEPVNATVALGYLAALGCTSVWVKDGTEAVARSAAERFDVILMDLNMPGMDGFAAAALIRQLPAPSGRVPIIALTAHDSTHRARCLQAGMDDMLSKPCTLIECSQVLRRWVKFAVTPPVESTAPSRAAAVEALSSLDVAAVARLNSLRTDGAAGLYPKLVALFESSSAGALVQLHGALAREDYQGAAAVCHKLASSAANVGALSFAKDVRQLEQLCAAGAGSRTLPVLARLQAAYPALIEEMALQLRKSA
jgi:signal transduction histidine kinase/ligand-binding sensor domain-containing protein/CheY-like chemotaxis protein/HPt (histidine-containing phosphotransfer) domain-containing protein